MNLITALGQAVDFIFKAARTYAETPEGAKELQDVIDALQGTDETPATDTGSETSPVVSQRVRR